MELKLPFITISFPSLMTLHLIWVIFLRFSRDFSALYSWINQRIALVIMIMRMTIASPYSPTKNEIKAEKIRIPIRKLLNCSKKIFRGEICWVCFRMLLPYCWRFFYCCCMVSPWLIDVLRSVQSCSIVFW